MNLTLIANLLGRLHLIVAAAFLPSAAWAVYFGETASLGAFIGSAGLVSAIGGVGILAVFLIVLPTFGAGGRMLFRFEASHGVPRMQRERLRKSVDGSAGSTAGGAKMPRILVLFKMFWQTGK